MEKAEWLTAAETKAKAASVVGPSKILDLELLGESRATGKNWV